MSAARAALPAAIALVLAAWHGSTNQALGPPTPGASAGVSFTDVTRSAGIAFRHTSGATGKKLLPETMGSGVAFLDIDNDGWQDAFLVNSARWPGARGGRPVTSALYRNNRDGTFTDITQQAGLATEFYGMGVTAADYDNDGWVDLYVTALGPNRLYRNRGGARFEDVTARAGVGDPGFSTSAAWLDYDRDGRLDLFVANYVEWTPDSDLFCTLDGKTKSYCTPESYKGQSPTLYRNRGNGTFENVTRAAGLLDPTSKALGVALLDYNGDGHLDVFAANDTQPNRLYRNNGNGTFTDVGVQAGVGFNEAGVARAGMGVDAADYDGTGRPSLVIGNFSNEMMSLYTNEGTGLFVDEAPTSNLGRDTLLTLTFAAFFFDVDLDGRLDIFTANGHVADDIERVQPRVKYAQPPHLFQNLGNRRFQDVATAAGAAFAQPIVGRGAAYADYDRDGDLDLLITTNNGPARLLRNDRRTAHHWLRLTLVGRTSNRSGVGARLKLSAPGRPAQVAMVKTGSSYLSQSELPVTFGLGAAAVPDATVEITWPGGRRETVRLPAADRSFVLTEGEGITTASPSVDRSPAVSRSAQGPDRSPAQPGVRRRPPR